MKFNQQTSTTTTMNHIPTTGQLAYSLPERKFTTQLFFPIGLYRDSWDTHTMGNGPKGRAHGNASGASSSETVRRN